MISEMEADLRDAEIVRLYLEGNRPLKIAEILGRERKSVLDCIKRTRMQWRETKLATYNEAVNFVDASCRHLMAEAWAGYRASCEPAIDRTDSRTTSTTGGSHTEATVHHEKPVGDVRFLNLIDRCILRIGQVAGIFDADARDKHPTKEQRTALIEVVIQTPDQLKQLQQMRFDELTEVAIEQAGGAELIVSQYDPLTEEPG